MVPTPAVGGGAVNLVGGWAAVLKLWARKTLGGGGWIRGRPRVGNLRWRQPSAGEESWLLPPEAVPVPEDTPEVRELRVEAALELVKDNLAQLHVQY